MCLGFRGVRFGAAGGLQSTNWGCLGVEGLYEAGRRTCHEAPVGGGEGGVGGGSGSLKVVPSELYNTKSGKTPRDL